MNLLKNAIRERVEGISTEALDFAISLFRPRQLNKGEHWITAGEHCDEIAFIESGILRIYAISATGEDITYNFLMQQEFVTLFSSFSTRQLAVENICALTDAQIYTIKRSDVERVYRLYPILQTLGRVEAERVAIRVEKRIAMLQTLTAEARYEAFTQQNSHIIQHASLHQIASFLGITRQHLARIRKKYS